MAERVEDVLVRLVVDMQAKVQGLADAKTEVADFTNKIKQSLDKLRTDIEKGISGDVVAQQTKAISASFTQLASQFGKSDASIGNSFKSLHDSISSFKDIYTKSLTDVSQQTVLSSQTIAEAIARIDAANTRSSKGAKFTEIRESLVQLQSDINSNLDPSLLAKRLDAVISSATTLAKQRKGELQTALLEAVVKPLSGLRDENLGRQLSSVIADAFKTASKFAKITIQPIELKDLQQDKLKAITESFSAIGRVVKLVGTDVSRWDLSLREAFGNDTAALNLFKAGLEHLLPIFLKLDTDSSSFGKAFNSTTKSSTDNLYTLQKVLEEVDKRFLGGTNVLGSQIASIQQLQSELRTLRGTDVGLKEIDKSFGSALSNVNNLKVAVQTLTNAFASGGKQSENFAGFAKTETAAKVLGQTIDTLTQKVNNLRDQSTRSDGTNILGNSLQLQLDAAITKVFELSKEFQKLNGNIIKIRTDHIDASLTQTAKAAETFERTAAGSIDKVRSGILSLGSTNLTSGVASSLSKLLNSLDNPLKLITDLQKVYSSFVSTVKSNVATVSITGVKDSIADFSSLIKIVQDYVNSIYAVEKANLEASNSTGKATTSQIQSVKTWESAVNTLNKLTGSLVEDSKQVANQATAYKLFSDTVKRSVQEASDAITRFQSVSSGSGTSVSSIVKEFDVFDATMSRTDRTLDNTTKKLQELVRAGATLPKQLIGTDFFGVKLNSVQDIINGIEKIKQSFNSTQTTLTEFASSARVIDTEYKKLAASVGSVSIPQNATVAASQYDIQLQNIIKSFGQASSAVVDFSSLQSVYSEHKRSLQSLYTTLLQVIDAERKMGASAGDISSLEQVRKSITAQTAAINVGLQRGGASLDILLQKTGRLQDLQNRFSQLDSSVQQTEATLSRLAKTGAGVDVLKDLHNEVSRLITERQNLITEVASAKTQLDSALQVAIRTVGSGGDLTQLKSSVQTANSEFNNLEQSIKQIPATIATLGAQMRTLEASSTPVNRLAAAVVQADRALQGTQRASSSFATTFDQQVQLLVNDLVKASGQIGIVRTSFEQRPREVLQSFMNDLRIKADDLARSYIEITKSIHLAESAAQAGFNINPASLTQAKDRAESLRLELERVSQATGTLREVMARLPAGSNALKSFDGVASSMAEVTDKASFLSRGMRALFQLMLNQNANRLGANLSDLQHRTDLVTAAVRQLENQLVGSMQNMDIMTMGLQMLGQAMIQPFKAGLDSFGKVEDTLTFIKGATEETGDAIENLAKTTSSVGSTSRYGVEQVADGFKQLALAGYDVEQQIDTLPTVLALATAAETNLGTATEIVVQIMSSQRLAVEEIGKATDIMSMAAIRTTATLTDMGTAFRYVGSIAGTMQNDIEDTAGAVALLHNAGLRGSLAGTALRGAFQALLNPTRDEAKVLEELSRRIGGAGLQITDTSGKFVGFVSLLKQFERAGVQTNEVLDLFGQRAGPGMAALLQLGSEKLEGLVDDLKGAEGSTANLATMMEKTLAGKFQILANSLNVLGESIGHSLSLALKPIVSISTEVVNRVNAIREALGPLTPIIDTVAASFAGLLVVIGGGALAWSMMLVPAAKFFAVLKTLTVVLLGTARAITVMATTAIPASLATTQLAASLESVWAASIAAGGGLKGLMVVIRALGLALVTTPIGLLITAVVTLAGVSLLLSRNTETANAALDRQMAIAANSGKEFDNLGKKIDAVGVKLQQLNNTSFSNNGDNFLNLPSAQNQVARFQALLDELVTRYNESGDEIKKGLQLEKTFNPLTGQLTGLKVISTETGKVITDLSTSMLSSATVANDLANATKSLNDEIGKLANKDAANAAEEKFTNQLRQHLEVLDQVAYATNKGSQQQVASLQERYNELLTLKKSYVDAEEALNKAKAANDEKAIFAATDSLEALQNKLFNMFYSGSGFGGGSIARGVDLSYVQKGLDEQITEIFSRLSGVKQDAAKFSQTVSNIIDDAVAKIKVSKGVVNVDAVVKTISEDLDAASAPAWFPDFLKGVFSISDANKAALLNNVRATFTELAKAAEDQAKRINVESVLETQFAALQRVTGTMLKTTETQVKELGTRMEELKKSMDMYKDNVDAFLKYRDLIAQASKSRLDVGTSIIQQETELALTQIKDTYSITTTLANGAFSDMSKAAIGWGENLKAVNTKVFDTFAAYQGEQKKVAKSAADDIYSYYRNSLEKQIDDLTRASSSITEVNYTIPVRMEAETTGFDTVVNGTLTESQGAVRRFVADAKRETSVLLQYTLTFDQKLFDSKVRLETEKFKIVKQGLDKERAEVASHYKAILPLYSVGSAERIKQEQEFAGRKKDLDLKGIQSTQAALDRIKEMYKANADKIKSIEEDKANFIARANKKRDDIENAGLNDVQRYEKDKQKIITLSQQAQLASEQGNLDKAKALYEAAMSTIEGLNFEPWDAAAKQFVKGSLDTVQNGMSGVSDKMKEAGLSQQKTLEDTAKGLEDILASFQTSLSQVETDLKKLADSLVELQKLHAKEIKLDFNDGDMLEKLNRITAAKEYLDRQFEKPIEIKVSGGAAVGQMLKLGAEQRQLEITRNTAVDDQRQLTQVQEQLDKTNNLRALYQDMSDLLGRMSKSQLPTGVELGKSLEQVNKEGSDGQKTFVELVKVIDDYDHSLNTILDTYAKTDLSAPKALYAELEKIKVAKDSLSADSNGTVVIDKNVTDLLSVSIERLNDFKQSLQTVDKAKVDALSNSFTELGGKVADVAKRTDDLKDIRIGGAARSQAPVQQWTEIKNVLVNAAPALKEMGVNTEKLDQVLSNTAQTADKAAVGIDQVVTAANQPTSPVNIPIKVDADKAKVEAQVSASSIQQTVDSEIHPVEIATTVRAPNVDATKQVQSETEAAFKPITITTDVSPPDVQTSIEALKQVKSELAGLGQLQDKADKAKIDLFTPDQLTRMNTARQYVDDLLATTAKDQLRVNVNQDSINSVVSTLDDVRQQASTVFDGFGKGVGEGQLKDKLQELLTTRNEIAAKGKLDLVDAGTFNKTTNGIIALKDSFEQFMAVRQQTADVPVFSTGAEQSLATVSNKLTSFESQLAQARNQELGFYISPDLETKLKQLQTQVEQFQQTATDGRGLDSSALDEFKQKLTKFANEVDNQPVKFDFTDLDAAYAEITNIKNTMATVPATMPLKTDDKEIQTSIDYLKELAGYDGRTVSMDVVTNLISRSSSRTGFNTGGLVQVLQMFAAGGLASIRRFAAGGAALFNTMQHSVVPGSGNSDTVPAMLTPGEFVIRKSMVTKYGVGFLNALNSGLLQFKALGGLMNELPSLATAGMGSYMLPDTTVPADENGPSVDVRLHINNEVFTMQSPRKQVTKLLAAVKQLER